MARYEASIFGRIRGKIGDAVGQYWKGVRYVRQYTTPTDRRSQAQLNVRQLYAILGVIYSAEHKELSPTSKTGLDSIALFEKDYGDYLKTCLREAHTTILNADLINFGENITWADVSGSEVGFEVVDNLLSWSCLLRLNPSLTHSGTFTQSTLKFCYLIYDYTSKQITTVTPLDTSKIFEIEKDSDYISVEFNQISLPAASVFLYFGYIECEYVQAGVTTKYRFWNIGRSST